MADFYSAWDKPERPLHAVPNDITTDGLNRWAAAALEQELGKLAAAHEGTRNDALNSAAFNLGQIVGGGSLDEDTVRQQLETVARGTGLDDDEIWATIASGLSAGQEHPRYPKTAPAPPIQPFDPDKIGDGFWDARPELTHIRDFAQARRAAPWATLGVTLTEIVTHTSHHIVLPPLVGGEASLNLFVAIVGPSGSGKGAAQHAGHDAMDLGLETHAIISVGSGEGIAHCFAHRVKGEVERTNWRVLADIPEIDSLIALGGRQGATLMPELRKAFMGERLGFAYADPAKRLPIDPHTYRFCLIAGVQPGRASGLLDDADGGTPQRFIWLPATDPGAPGMAPREPQPLHWAKSYHDYQDEASEGRTRLKLPQRVRDDIDTARLARLQGNTTDARLDGHLGLTRLKAAAALMLLDGRRDMTEEDWELAGVLIDVSNACRASIEADLAKAAEIRNTGRAEAEAGRAILVHDRLEEAATKRVGRTVMRRLRAADEAGLSASELRRMIAMRDRQHVDSATEALVTAGQITRQEHADGVRFTATEGS